MGCTAGGINKQVQRTLEGAKSRQPAALSRSPTPCVAGHLLGPEPRPAVHAGTHSHTVSCCVCRTHHACCSRWGPSLGAAPRWQGGRCRRPKHRQRQRSNAAGRRASRGRAGGRGIPCAAHAARGQPGAAGRGCRQQRQHAAELAGQAGAHCGHGVGDAAAAAGPGSVLCLRCAGRGQARVHTGMPQCPPSAASACLHSCPPSHFRARRIIRAPKQHVAKLRHALATPPPCPGKTCCVTVLPLPPPRPGAVWPAVCHHGRPRLAGHRADRPAGVAPL